VREPSPSEADRDHLRRRVSRCLPLREPTDRALRDACDLVSDHRADLWRRPELPHWKQVRRFEGRGVEIGSHRLAREALAKKAGYKLAVTTDWGSLQSASRPFALKRLRVLDTTGVSGLAAMLGG
jgi:hypothetical protein